MVDLGLDFNRICALKWGMIVDKELSTVSELIRFGENLDLAKAAKLKSPQEVLESGFGTCLEGALMMGTLLGGKGQLVSLYNHHAMWLYENTLFSLGYNGLVSFNYNRYRFKKDLVYKPFKEGLYTYRTDFFTK